MQCPKCGYLMSSFDDKCPRCTNLGEPKTGDDAKPPNGNPTIPTTSLLLANSQHKTIIFCAVAAIFGIGYFSPWATISFFGVSLGLSGSSASVNFFVLALIIAATGICIYEYMAQSTYGMDLTKTILCAGCLCFSADKIASIIGFSISPGYGLILMLLSSGVLFYLAIRELPLTSKWVITGVETALLIVVIIYAGSAGDSQRIDYKSTFNDTTAAAASPSSDLARESDLSSMEQLALAIFKYIDHNDDALPNMSNVESFKADVTPYLDNNSSSNLDIFVQADTQDPFQPNPALSKIAYAKINNPEAVVELYQKTSYSDMTRYVVFLDGHHKLIDENKWTTLKQQSGIP